MKTMIVLKVLLKDLIASHLKQENGLNEVLELTLNAMMKHERSLYLKDANDNNSNGYRPGRVYGHGKLLELRIPIGVQNQTSPENLNVIFRTVFAMPKSIFRRQLNEKQTNVIVINANIFGLPRI